MIAMFTLEIPISNTNHALNISDFVGRILGYYAKPKKIELQDSLEHSCSCTPCQYVWLWKGGLFGG